MRKILDRITIEATSVNTTPQTVGTIDLGTLYNMTNVAASIFVATISLKCWSYNTTSSTSFGSYHILPGYSFNRNPESPYGIQVLQYNTDSSDPLPQIVFERVQGSSNMVADLTLDVSAPSSVNVNLTAGSLASTYTLEHLIVADINIVIM